MREIEEDRARELPVRQIPLFTALSEDELQDLNSKLEQIELPAGTMLFREGDLGDRMYIVLEGEVEIVKAIDTSDELPLAVRGKGELVGDMSLLSRTRERAASARIVQLTKLLMIPHSELDAIIRHHQEVAYDLARMLSARLQESDSATIKHLQVKNQQLTQAYNDLKAAQAQVIEKERLEQELQVARDIQRSMLPKELPSIPGWQISTFYQPARAVGGDFYGFVNLPDGRLGIVVGDVSGKGIPAALVMATTLSVLRGISRDFPHSLSAVLERANEILSADIPPGTFVTCFCAVLDPNRRHLIFANAGNCLPLRWLSGTVMELRATGMPLGLMPDATYGVQETFLSPGEGLLFYSDGIIEAHDANRKMFGTSRLSSLVTANSGSGAEELISSLLSELHSYTGPGWEQEDDIMMVVLQENTIGTVDKTSSVEAERAEPEPASSILAHFSISSQPGNERLAIEQVVDAVRYLNLPSIKIERLRTAVGEAVMNAMEHGNKYRANLPVDIQVRATPAELAVRITDRGEPSAIPTPTMPELEAQLAGLEEARGWGLVLIENMVDEVRKERTDTGYTVELVMYRNEDSDHG